jgi:membrane protease YdiL (CAAX protease family)
MSHAFVKNDDSFAAALRGFGPTGILAIVVILLLGNYPVAPASGLLVLLWAERSHTPWREIGFVRPPNWAKEVALGIALGIAFKFAMKALVMPLLGGPAVNPAFHYLAGNTAALPGAIYAMVVGAGFGEETVFRGFFFERLGKLLGPGGRAKIAIVLITSALFGLAHYQVQGLPGVAQAIVTGLVFGTIFARTGRLWLVMCAHAAFDLTALWMIYTSQEAAVAHLIFR